MNDKNNLLEVNDLCITLENKSKKINLVDHISFSVPLKSIVCIVGESGCGKSLTAKSILGLLNQNNIKISNGSINFYCDGDEGVDLANISHRDLNKIRGNNISIIHQDPMTALNPLYRVGSQISENIKAHTKINDKAKLKREVISLIEGVGINNSEEVYRSYPHELSGGMRQRIVIAMAVSLKPLLVIADEPTTALDVTIQAQILNILKQLVDRNNSSVLLVTHDLQVVSAIADYVIIMYAGKIVEKGTCKDVFSNPAHPYTNGLLRANPALCDGDRLYSIEGTVPQLDKLPKGCYFANRCNKRDETCEKEYPKMVQLTNSHCASCHLVDDVG